MTPAVRRCVVVGGTGAVGSMFVELLRGAGCEVTIVDPAAGVHGVPGDITAIDAELARELAAADLVVLALPEPVALACATGVSEAMRPGALLVDTLSVKTPIVRVLQDGRADVEVLSLNPMFAPSLGMAGRPVAVIEVRGGPLGAELSQLVEACGALLVPLDADEHDRLTSAAQALTHAAVLAFGLALDRLDVDVRRLTAIAPPPHATLLGLLARIVSGTPDVYWDVQVANPGAPAARAALTDGARLLAELTDTGDQQAFTATLHRLRATFGPELDHYRALCARAFEATK